MLTWLPHRSSSASLGAPRRNVSGVAATDYQGFEADGDTVIWRYMAVRRLTGLLEGHLYFAAAHQFDDQFEGAITVAEHARREASMVGLRLENDPAAMGGGDPLASAFADLRRMTKISCWHARPHENVAMWERYRPDTGPGIAVASTVHALKASLSDFRLQPRYGYEPIVVGAVRYIDYATEQMTDRSMLGTFMHKRIEHQDETEIRALLSLRTAAEHGIPIPDDGVAVDIDPRVLITEIRASPSATDAEIEDLAEAISGANVGCGVSRSSLAAEPMY